MGNRGFLQTPSHRIPDLHSVVFRVTGKGGPSPLLLPRFTLTSPMLSTPEEKQKVLPARTEPGVDSHGSVLLGGDRAGLHVTAKERGSRAMV